MFGNKRKHLVVDAKIHRDLMHIAIDEGVDLKDLVTAVLQRALRDGLVYDVIDEEFPEAEEEEGEELEGGESE